MIRGSRKHVLDWVEHPNFATQFVELLAPLDVQLDPDAPRMPASHAASLEARLDTFGPFAVPGHSVWPELGPWWLKHRRGANTPNGDLALACTLDATAALCLVEAKANVPELSAAGKPSRQNSSPRSIENAERIEAALADASRGLTSAGYDATLSSKSHYQLANRLAFAWKLAASGIPVALVYLGFLGDEGIRDAGAPIRTAEAWDDLFSAHLRAIAPGIRVNERMSIGAGMWVLSRSREVLEESEPRKQKALGERL